MAISDMERRFERIVNLHVKLNELLNNLPFETGAIPGDVLNKLKDKILNDKELRNLINGIKEKRAPRFIMVGCTGAGKSSLINAITGRYLVETSDVFVGTTDAKKIDYRVDGKLLFQIIDTRGIGESVRHPDKKQTPEKQLEESIKEFEPDAVLFVLPADVRAHIDEDVQTLKKICQMAGKQIPLVAVVTRVDKLEPDTPKDPLKYPRHKKENIEKAVSQVRNILKDQNIEHIDIIPVSAKIDWDRYPDEVLKTEWHTLKIEGDYRYNIEKLVETLASNIDIRAGTQLRLNYRIDLAARKIAELIVKIFSNISAIIGGAVVVPIADLPILCGLQVMLVSIIAYLSGKDADKDAVLEFIVGLGVVGGAGFILRTVVRQTTKLLNIVPWVGIPVNGAIAYTGTYSIGKAAIAYFFDDVSQDKLGSVFKEAEEECK